MSEIVPVGWKVEPLSDHASRVRSKNDIGNTNVLTASAIDGLINQREYFNKSVASSDISHYTLLRRGDFAYNKSYSHGYPVGVVRRLERYDLGVLSPLYICFSLDSDECDETYLSYYFDSYRFERELNSVVQEGARAHGLLNIPVNDFFDRELLLPPLPEQKKIASILTSVDEVIENTQQQIDKLQDLKKATMNELLTKGIGHTEFKDSELGRIPKSWEVTTFGNLGKWNGGGTPSKSRADYWNGDIPWVSPKDMKSDFIDETEDYISISAVKNSSVNLINEGAILIVVRSGILKHTLPVAISNCEVTINQDMKALSVNSNVSNLFVYYFLLSKNHEILRSTLKAGNTVESIDTEVFSEYPIPLPPISEQNSIAKIVDSISLRVSAKLNQLHQTQSLKKSLMQDLLTGKVRVSVH